jgi:large subunit ribosomal protein L14
MSKRGRAAGGPHRARITTGLPVGALIKAADNSGAKVLNLIAVIGYKGRLRRLASAAVGDMVVVSVTKGTPQMRRQVINAIIIRQKKPYRRTDGTWISFEDNAAVVTTPTGEPRGSDIRGPVAKEAAERWSRVASTAKIII